jgi:hypothetical protein
MLGHIVGDHARVADQHHVRRQALLVLPDEEAEVGGAHLFLALDHHLHVAGQVPGVQHGLQGFHVHVELALVVGAATGVDHAVLHHGFKRRAVPEVHWVGRLHIVVAVHQHRGFGRVRDLLPVHDGVACRGADLRAVQAGLGQAGLHGLGAAGHLGFVPGVGAHTGNAQQVQELVEEPVLVLLNVRVDGGHGLHGMGCGQR